MSERSAYYLLTDMLTAIETVQQYITGLDYNAFVSNGMARDAIIRNIQLLGEAANRIPKELRAKYTTIEWMRIIRTRHILVHDYFGIDYSIMWRIITVHLPPLQQDIEQLLVQEFPDELASGESF